MRVQLVHAQRLEIAGRVVELPPGHIVDINRKLAEIWVTNGSAILVTDALPSLPPDSGVLTLSHSDFLEHLFREGIPCQQGPLSLPFQHTMIVTAPVEVGLWTIRRGFACLDKWDMAVPIKDYVKTYASEATGAEKEWGERVLGDLRIPLMDTRVLWVKRSPITESLVAAWSREPGRREFSFMRVLYQHPLAVNVLPKL